MKFLTDISPHGATYLVYLDTTVLNYFFWFLTSGSGEEQGICAHVLLILMVLNLFFQPNLKIERLYRTLTYFTRRASVHSLQ